jgi:hypothetical protein
MMASVRSTAQVAETARQGVGILVPGTPAAVRMENIARFLDHVSESLARAVDQARDVLHTKSGPTSDVTARPSPDQRDQAG